jgi:hypothetical protein
MTVSGFRRIALALSDVVEGAHMGHPDFRVQNRIFATIQVDPRYGMVSLTPDQQACFVRDHPETFAPVNGAWGRGGATTVTLAVAKEEAVGEAMTLAWQNRVAKNAEARPPRSRATIARKTSTSRRPRKKTP